MHGRSVVVGVFVGFALSATLTTVERFATRSDAAAAGETGGALRRASAAVAPSEAPPTPPFTASPSGAPPTPPSTTTPSPPPPTTHGWALSADPSKVLILQVDTRPLTGAALREGPFYSLSAALAYEFAQSHGYGYLFGHMGGVAGPAGDASKFSKPAALWAAVRHGLSQGRETTVFIDTDAYFRSSNVSLAEHLRTPPDALAGRCGPAPLSFASNWPDVPDGPNTGFIIINNRAALPLLRQWYQPISTAWGDAAANRGIKFHEQDILWALAGWAGARGGGQRIVVKGPTPAVAPGEPPLSRDAVCVFGEKPFAAYEYLEPKLQAGRSWQWVRHFSSWPPEAAKRVPTFSDALRGLGYDDAKFAATLSRLRESFTLEIDIPATERALDGEIAAASAAAAAAAAPAS